MTIKERQFENIQRLKKEGYTIPEAAKILKLPYNTVSKYWGWEPASKTEKKPEPIPETPPYERFPCPDCKTVMVFLRTDKRVRCPKCGELWDVVINDGQIMRKDPIIEWKFPEYPDMWKK